MTRGLLPEGRTLLSSVWLKEKAQDYSQVIRVEVIDASGRAYTKLNIKSVELQLQDDARTLKIFISE